MSANPGTTAVEPHPYLGPSLELSVFMAEQDQDQERRKHWTGHERGRLRQYQREWEVRAKAAEDRQDDRPYESRRPIDPPARTDKK